MRTRTACELPRALSSSCLSSYPVGAAFLLSMRLRAALLFTAARSGKAPPTPRHDTLLSCVRGGCERRTRRCLWVCVVCEEGCWPTVKSWASSPIEVDGEADGVCVCCVESGKEGDATRKASPSRACVCVTRRVDVHCAFLYFCASRCRAHERCAWCVSPLPCTLSVLLSTHRLLRSCKQRKVLPTSKFYISIFSLLY